LTAVGYFTVVLLFALILYLWIANVYRFLTIEKAVATKTLIVEGWVEDYALKNALNYYRKNHFKHLIVTGIPLRQRHNFARFDNTAPLAASVLHSFGFKDTIFEASIPSNIYINRTYNTAVASRMIFEQHPRWPKSLMIYSVGVHSKRTKRMFDLAFGDAYRIGIVAGEDDTYDSKHFWRTSKGFRTVSNEFVAYLWVCFFFHPDYRQYRQNIFLGRYVDKLLSERKAIDKEYADSLRSPIDKIDLKHFTGLSYYPVDPAYRIKVAVSIDTSQQIFAMPTNTERKPEYRIYAHLNFKVRDTLCQLTAYQNMANLVRPEFSKLLFVPFRDLTSGKTTYAAGRYLDMPIPSSDSAYIDFNEAYNPYCAYSHRWSCPLVPFENYLDVAIFAGEKKN